VQIKNQDEARVWISLYLNGNPESPQRELDKRLTVSLGALNYCLKSLMDRGLVKAHDFQRNSKKFDCAFF